MRIVFLFGLLILVAGCGRKSEPLPRQEMINPSQDQTKQKFNVLN